MNFLFTFKKVLYLILFVVIKNMPHFELIVNDGLYIIKRLPFFIFKFV